MPAHIIQVNRAPVLTLWAAVVAQRLGFRWGEALTLGRAVAGLNAQAKGQRLGIFKPHEQSTARLPRGKNANRVRVELLGREIPVVASARGVRATCGGQPIDPVAVTGYLARKFGDDLSAARTAMSRLAGRYSPAALAAAAYSLYVRFRPAVPAGARGRGAAGRLDLNALARLGRGSRASIS